MKKIITLLAVLGFFSLSAQIDQGKIKGIVIDEAGEPVPFANVSLVKDGKTITGTTTDFDGLYVLPKLDTGIYAVLVNLVGYQPAKVSQVGVSTKKITQVNVSIQQGVQLNCVEIAYSKPLFVRDRTRVSRRKSKKQISNLVDYSGKKYVTPTNSNQVKVRGARTGSVTFIDGVKVIGSTQLPKAAIEEVSVKTNGISSQYENKKSAQANEIITNKTKNITYDYSYNERKVNPYLYSEENYQNIADNEFESPKKAPLSTFSVDVDRASYANMRRYINDGYFPPQSAVRIEELINYFDYKYPQPKDEHPLSITTELADSPWNKDRKLALIGIQGKEINMDDAPPSNLVFLIDVSGSMSSADKLGLLKKGLKLLTHQLREQDRIAIVVYAGAAGLVLKSTSGKEKFKIKSILDELESGGSTAGGAGIQLAYKVAKKNFIKDGNNRIILASDGDFNVGLSSQFDLVKLIEKERKGGVFLSVLGFGRGNLNDQTMEQMANHGNGNYNYIDNILEAKKVLVNEMGGTLFTIAKDVKVQAEFNPSVVKSYRLVGYVNRLLEDEDFNNDAIDAGEMGSGHTVTVMYELIMVGSAENITSIDDLKYQSIEENLVENPSLKDEVLTVKFRYKKPDKNRSILMTSILKNESKRFVQASENFRFSASVASFGMKLRGSQSAENISFKNVLKMAKGSKGSDDDGYRAEFIRLVEAADLMD